MDYTYQIRLRRGTSSQWSISNPILASGEPGLATDLNYYKIGDGVTPWNDLPWTTGLKGDSASVTAGETITGAPGSSADVTNSGTELNAIFDFVIPEGMPGKDLVVHEGDRDDPPSDWTNQQFLWDPNGEIHEEVPLTEAETDARYISKSLLTAKGDLMARDASTTVRVPVGQDGQLLTADSSALQGMAWKPNEAYSKAVSDARYEKKLLTQAVWRVDAGALSADGLSLLDLSGNDRPAVFGAGAAKPLVLPFDGEPYVYLPGISGNRVQSALNFTVKVGTVWQCEFSVHSPSSGYLGFGGGVGYFGVQLLAYNTSFIRLRYPKAGGSYNSIDVDTGVNIQDGQRHTLRVEMQSVEVIVTVDDRTPVHRPIVEWPERINVTDRWDFNVTDAPFRLYGFFTTDFILDPRNVNADYTKIANTGTAGGDWTINRAATGFKTAVVDRPLLLFGSDGTVGNGQYARANGYKPPAVGTFIAAYRPFGSPNNYGGVLVSAASASTNSANKGWALMDFPSATNNIRGGSWGAVTGGVYQSSPLGKEVVQAYVVTPTYQRQIVNGVAKQSDTVDSGLGIGTSSLGLTVGGWGSSYWHFTGEFYSAAIFDRALTDAEVAQASAELLGTPHYKQADPHPQYLRQRVTRPNIDDRLVETWDGTKWIVTHYDSGVRNVAVLLINGWAGSCYARRDLDGLHLFANLDKSGASSDQALSLPTGFRPRLVVPGATSNYPLVVQAGGGILAANIAMGRFGGTNNELVIIDRTSSAPERRFAITTAVQPEIPTSLPGTLVSPAP